MQQCKLRSSIINNTPKNVITKEFAIHCSSRKCFFDLPLNTNPGEKIRAFRYTWDEITFQHNVHDPETKHKHTKNPFYDCEYGDRSEIMKNINIQMNEGKKRKDTPAYRSIKRKLSTLELHDNVHYAFDYDKRITTVFIIDISGERYKTGSAFHFTGVVHVIIYDNENNMFHYTSNINQYHKFKKGNLNMHHTVNEMIRVEKRGGVRKVKTVATPTIE